VRFPLPSIFCPPRPRLAAREQWEIAAAAGVGIGGDARGAFDDETLETFRFAGHPSPFVPALALWELGYAVDVHAPDGILLVAPP
jgi:hypothetical protein